MQHTGVRPCQVKPSITAANVFEVANLKTADSFSLSSSLASSFFSKPSTVKVALYRQRYWHDYEGCILDQCNNIFDSSNMTPLTSSWSFSVVLMYFQLRRMRT